MAFPVASDGAILWQPPRRVDVPRPRGGDIVRPSTGAARVQRIGFFLGVMAATALAPHIAAAVGWDEIVAAANGEGEVDVHGGPGKLFGQALTEGFRRAYPQIKINFSGLSGRDAIPKILREREAGLYTVDVYIGGTFSTLQSLKPAGAFAPLRPALVLPAVLDDKAWYGGLDGEWMDKEKSYVLGFEAEVTPTLMINRDFVAPAELETYQDLLKPQIAGKIVWDDPRLPGQGAAAGTRLYLNFGADYLKRLFAEQSIVYIANPRQNAEWVVRGRYPIGIGTSAQELKPFTDQGLGKAIVPFDAPLAHPTIAPGYGTVSLMDRAPHPNAAKVYINWLLSPEGQTAWGETGNNSRRLDVPHAAPEIFPKPGVTYIPEQNEENIAAREAAVDLARRFIRAQP